MTETDAIQIPTDAILAKLGPDGEHWIQGQWTDNGGMCLHQGIRVCQPEPGDAYLIEQVARREGWGITFNDSTDTEWSDIVNVLNAHTEVLPAQLETTFGPNWALVSNVVRQTAVLTDDQAKELDAAGVAAGVAARAAAGDAAWDAARDAARDAAGAAAGVAAGVAAVDAAWAAAGDAAWVAAGDAAVDAAWAAAVDAAVDAAWAAARAAARDAARAAAMRDLVGKHGFTQEHYNTLTASWRAVFPGYDD